MELIIIVITVIVTLKLVSWYKPKITLYNFCDNCNQPLKAKPLYHHLRMAQGDVFKCIKTVYDLENNLAFERGKTYVCFKDDHMINEQGDEVCYYRNYDYVCDFSEFLRNDSYVK